MPQKNALGAAALAFFLATGFSAGAWGGSESRSGPPLQGVFARNFSLLAEPAPAPEDRVEAADNSQAGVQDFEGQVVLLNFWATWCAPCVAEMPSLDRVQASLGREGLVVMAVSEDRSRKLAIDFLDSHKLDNLDLYLDSDGSYARAYAVSGLPTSILIDRRGRVVGGLLGAAEWDGPEAEALIRYYLEEAPADEEPEAPIKIGG